MVTLGKVHVGDKNTDLQLLVEDTGVSDTNSVVDLSTATTLEMVIQDPDGTETTVTASVLNAPGTDGYMRYLNSDATLFNQAGLWKYRAKITFSDGGIFQSNNGEFEVLAK